MEAVFSTERYLRVQLLVPRSALVDLIATVYLRGKNEIGPSEAHTKGAEGSSRSLSGMAGASHQGL